MFICEGNITEVYSRNFRCEPQFYAMRPRGLLEQHLQTLSLFLEHVDDDLNLQQAIWLRMEFYLQRKCSLKVFNLF